MIDKKSFETIVKKELADYLSDSNIRTFEPGDLIIKSGRQIKFVYLVKSGLSAQTITDNDGKERLISVKGEMSFLGLSTCFSGTSQDSDNSAIGNLEAYKIPAEELRKKIESSTELAFSLLKSTSVNFENYRYQINVKSRSFLSSRLASALLYLEGQEAEINRNTFEISELVSLSPELTIQLLSELEQNKKIRVLGRSISIEDRASLLRIALS